MKTVASHFPGKFASRWADQIEYGARIHWNHRRLIGDNDQWFTSRLKCCCHCVELGHRPSKAGSGLAKRTTYESSHTDFSDRIVGAWFGGVVAMYPPARVIE